MAVWHARFVSDDIGLVSQLGGLGLMMSPYLGLCLFARWINRPVLLLGSALLMIGLDVANGIAVMKSTSSTAPVALVLLPPLMLLVGVPALLIVAAFLRWALDGED